MRRRVTRHSKLAITALQSRTTSFRCKIPSWTAPDKSIIHSNRAACFLKLGRLEEALKEAEQSVSLDEKNVKREF